MRISTEIRVDDIDADGAPVMYFGSKTLESTSGKLYQILPCIFDLLNGAGYNINVDECTDAVLDCMREGLNE